MTSRRACFVNLSNHPSAMWEETQITAALALAERIADIAFPAVPPDADEKAIAALAEECAAKVPPETSHALVQGEFTLGRVGSPVAGARHHLSCCDKRAGG